MVSTVISRRIIIKGLGLSAALPALLSASTGGEPDAFSGAMRDRTHWIVALDHRLQTPFILSVPGRVHGFARHPAAPDIVAFARRPGRFAIVFDRNTGEQIESIAAASGRHFYGHGVYSQDGRWLFATENAYEHGTGLIGVYDADAGYRRLGEFASGGIGPHEIARLPGSDLLVVANGGVRTHPDTGRSPLNLETMASSLAYLDGNDGALLAQYSLPGWSQLSIRHLSVDRTGLVALGMQHRGPQNQRPPLLATHRLGQAIVPLPLPAALSDGTDNYIGSVAIDPRGRQLFASAPRGDRLFEITLADNAVSAVSLADCCGLRVDGRQALVSTGQGELIRRDYHGIGSNRQVSDEYQWDNHLG